MMFILAEKSKYSRFNFKHNTLKFSLACLVPLETFGSQLDLEINEQVLDAQHENEH